MQDQPHCTATSKRSGQPCHNRPMNGRAVCRMHGGKSRKGLNHPSTTHGRYSQDLLLRMMHDYEAGKLDPEALVLLDEIGLSTAMIQQTLRSSQLPAFWGELQDLYEKVCHLYLDGLVFLGGHPSAQELTALLTRPEGGELGRALGELGEQIEKGRECYSLDTPTIETVTKLLESKRRLVESETKRFSDQGWLWPFPKVQAYVGRILSCVRRHVPEEMLVRISDDIRAGTLPADPAAARRPVK